MSRRATIHTEVAPRLTTERWRAAQTRTLTMIATLALAAGVQLMGLGQRASAETIIDQDNSIILENTTWGLAGSPYILLRDVEVRPQATLTIAAGVEVRFSGSDAITSGEDPQGVELVVKGALIASGTEAQPIRMNGQNLSGPLAHATGIRFSSTATASSLSHVRIEGLAYGVDIRAGSGFTVSADHLYIDAGKVAFRRSVAMGDQVFTNSTLTAPEAALELVSGVEDAVFIFSDGEINGDVVFNGDLSISSELTIVDSVINGDWSVMGSLQAGASLRVERSEVQLGKLYVQGGVNTNASVSVTSSQLLAKTNKSAIEIGGAILADASITFDSVDVRGDVKLGPAGSFSGEGGGQYVFVDTPSSWSEAQGACAAMGGRLADAEDSAEAERLYELSKRSSSGFAWIGGTLTAPPCSPGSTFIDIGTVSSCTSWDQNGFPVQNVTTGKNCLCANSCPELEETKGSCVPYSGFTCQQSVVYQARLPDCDTGDVTGEYCYGDSLSWLWDGGASFDQGAALWANGEADRLSCYSGEETLLDELHIAIDVQDPTGGPNGRLGLWRAREASNEYGYICEGKLALVSAQDSSRGSLSVVSSDFTGRFLSHLGQLTLSQNTFSGTQNHSLFRAANIAENSFVGAFNLTSRSTVILSKNNFKSSLASGGGVVIESDMTNAYGNTVDEGLWGLLLRGPALVENNIITRSSKTAIALYPEMGPSPSDETAVMSNTLVQNVNGVSVKATVNAPPTMLANNLIYRGEGVGIANLGTSSVSTSHNNVADYDTLYQAVSPDAGSLSVNPVLVADFPADPPTLRIDSGSPLIDVGSCALATELDFDDAPRPFDGDFDDNPGCDIGAYEFGPAEVFVYADGVLADSETFATGREVTLSLWGRRDGFVFEVNPVDWNISEAVGLFDEATGRFRPSPTPGLYPSAINAAFGGLTASLDVDLECGCIAPDLNGQSGGCNDVPECYFTDWSNTCNVRENYCRSEQLLDLGSFNNPLVVTADETVQIRAGGRDLFGTVFQVAGPFTYAVVAGGGSVDSIGRFTASTVAGDYPQSISISKGAVTGLSDLIVVPAEAHSITITKPQQSVGTTRTLQYSAVVLDRFGNVIPDAPLSWSLVNAEDSQIDPVTGRVTAGCIPGLFGGAVVATSGAIQQSSDLTVSVGGANLKEITITPASVEVSATESVNFEAFVTDNCDYTRRANGASFTARTNAGTINNSTGAFTASCNLGVHADDVTVSAEGFEVSASVTITDAPLAAVRLQPEVARISVNDSTIFEAIGEDTCGRTKTVEPQWQTSIVNATTSAAGANNFRRLNISCATVNSYASGIRATVGPFQAVASVEVVAGLPDSLIVNQSSVTLPAGNEVQLIASAEDACSNSRDDAIRYQASNGQVNATGLYTAGCVRGSYNSAIVVSAGDLESLVDVTVIDGVLNSIEIEPSAVTIQAGDTRSMRANLFDGCRNRILGEATWSVAQGGSITEDGVFTAGDTAGTFSAAIVAELNGFQDQADLTVTPAAANQILISPNPIVVAAGSSTALQVTAIDSFGNTFEGDATWTINPNAGVVTSSDTLIAGQRVGVYPDAITARVGGATQTLDIEIVPADISDIVIEALPSVTAETYELSDLTAGQGLTITLEATALDPFGNEVTVTPSSIQWAVSQGGGTAAPVQGEPRAVYTVGTKAASHTISATIGPVTGSINTVIKPAEPAEVFIFDPTPPNNTVTQVTIEPNQSYQLGVRVEDTYSNVINMPVTYAIDRPEEDLLADPPVIPVNASVSPSGLIRAGTIAGEATVMITVTPTLVAEVDLSVIPGTPVQIAVSPEQITTGPAESLSLTATVLDAFGNVIIKASPANPSASVAWSGLNVSGTVSTTGIYTSGSEAGSFSRALVVRGRGLERFVDVTVTPGAPVSANVTPSPIIATPNSVVALGVVYYDSYGNVTSAPGAALQWGLRPNSAFNLGSDGLLTLDCLNSPGEYVNEVETTIDLPGVEQSLVVKADIEVRPGPTVSVEVDPTRAEVAVTNTYLFSAVAKDSCGYNANDAPQWSIIRGEGTITAQGRFVASTTSTLLTPDEVDVGASVQPVVIAAHVREISSPEVLVTILPGPATQLELEPAEIEAVVTDRVELRAIAQDEYGNRWLPAGVDWAVANAQGIFTENGEPNQVGPVGSINELGVLETAMTSGRYLRSVKATFGARSSTANVVLVPDVASRIEVSPNFAVLTPNQVFDFEATTYDQFDNVILSAAPSFTCDPEVGLCTESGVLTATDRVGEYLDSIEARFNGVVGRASVEIQNSEPARIEIEPAVLRAPMNSLNVFSATVYDSEGVEIEGATVTWTVIDPELGFVNPMPNGDARLTVGLVSKEPFSQAIVARYEGVEAYVDVFVPVDFDVDGIDDSLELDNGLNPQDPNDALEDYDNDGLTNRQELNATADSREKLDIRDADTDNDGVLDGDEPAWDVDTDRDQLINALDPDSDNDGILDGTELGVTNPSPATDNSDNFQADLDPETTTDPLREDSDGDLIPDGQEDLNANGRLDPGETPPTRNFNYIYCDPTAEVTGCPDGLICLETICTEPQAQTDRKAPDTGCQAGDSRALGLVWLLALVAMIGRRRMLA